MLFGTFERAALRRRTANDMAAAVAEALQVPRAYVQLADPTCEAELRMHTSAAGQHAAAGLPPLSDRPGRVFGWPPAGRLFCWTLGIIVSVTQWIRFALAAHKRFTVCLC
jgi:hypothetical protein